MHLPLSWSVVQKGVHMRAFQAESGGCLGPSAHSSPLTLLSCSILLSPCSLACTPSLSTSLSGSTSINNSSLSCHTLPCVCVCVWGWGWDLFAAHIKMSDMHTDTLLCACLQTCANTALFVHASKVLYVLPSDHYSHCHFCAVCVYGGSVVWLITAAGVPYIPSFPRCWLPLQFVSFPPYILLHCFASFLSFILPPLMYN